MAKKSAIAKNRRRQRMAEKQAKKRAELKAIMRNLDLPQQERFDAMQKLRDLSPNGSKVRIKNRCEVTGRPHAYYRRFAMCRVMLRELGSEGLIPGLVKSSW